MTASHWDRLSDNLKGLVYQFDSTTKDKFNEVLKELMDKVYNANKRVQRVDYILNGNSGIATDTYQLPLQLRRKSKVKNLYLKKTHRFSVLISVLQPVAHNAKALKEQRLQIRIQNRWRCMVKDYLHAFWHIMMRLKHDHGMLIYKRLLN